MTLNRSSASGRPYTGSGSDRQDGHTENVIRVKVGDDQPAQAFGHETRTMDSHERAFPTINQQKVPFTLDCQVGIRVYLIRHRRSSPQSHHSGHSPLTSKGPNYNRWCHVNFDGGSQCQ